MQVMTVTGPLPAEELGVTDAHDHLFLRSPLLVGHEMDDPAVIEAEVRQGARSGIATIVELTPIGLGRRPDGLRALSQETGVHIVGATGYHRDAHYADGHWVLEATDEELLACMTTDLHDGMHTADWADPAGPLDPARAGVIKAGASLDRISANETRRLVCTAAAAKIAGVAVVVHTEAATCADEICDLLMGEGLPAGQIVLAHMDREPDPERHGELLARGVFLVYDTIGRTQYHPDSARLDLIEAVCAGGYGRQIVLGLDLGKRSYLAMDGGHGLRYLMDEFVPQLRERLGDELTQRLLVDNPAAALALRTPVAP